MKVKVFGKKNFPKAWLTCKKGKSLSIIQDQSITKIIKCNLNHANLRFKNILRSKKQKKKFHKKNISKLLFKQNMT